MYLGEKNVGDRKLLEGNVAICWGAVSAGCQAYFGYPITPQNEIIEFCANEFPKMGKVFVQAQSELGSINMLYGALASGARAMTATSGPGWSLMQETISAMVNAELPAVIVDVQRGGPVDSLSVMRSRISCIAREVAAAAIIRISS